ncbi:helix-turn-helix transcriptional regulator [Metabacillus idriensis]|uniref:helix-turn-helix transcriptional regulator n=1 Tax=Metabacillus idriensis TaxID=324768 RepID=UPI001CD807B5|nr:helix-turn-helix transcriptional regulator [Metabacillus idriensis]
MKLDQEHYILICKISEGGFLTKEDIKENGRIRKYYSITKEGEAALEKSKSKLREHAKEV